MNISHIEHLGIAVKRSFILLLLSFMVFGCVREHEIVPQETPEIYELDPNLVESEDGTIEIIGDPVAVLGKEINNPHKTDNIKKALDNLSDEIRALAPDFQVSVTHRYYRFPCRDTVELNALKRFALENDVELFDFPFLEREIVGEGIYRDPSRAGTRVGGMTEDGEENPDEAPNPMYAVIPISITPPGAVYPELVQEMCVPDDEVLPEEFVDALIDQTMMLTGNEDKMGAEDIETRAKKKWSPNGRIMVWDDAVDGYIGVPRAKVRCYSWRKVKTYKMYTNADGYFWCSDSFKGKGLHSIVWEDSCWDIRNDGMQAYYHGASGNKEENIENKAWNRNIKGGKSVYNATITRACYRWWYGDAGGLSRPNLGKNVNLKISYNHRHGRAFFQKNGLGGPLRDIAIFGKWNKDDDFRATDDIMCTVFHEIAHAVHTKTYNLINWNKINNFWTESWAVFAELVLATTEYDDLGVRSNYIDNHQGWNRNLDPNDARYYSPIYINLMDDSIQGTGNYNSIYNLVPIDFIQNMPVSDIEKIALRCESLSEFETWLQGYIGQPYLSDGNLTQDVIDSYLRVYKAFL